MTCNKPKIATNRKPMNNNTIVSWNENEHIQKIYAQQTHLDTYFERTKWYKYIEIHHLVSNWKWIQMRMENNKIKYKNIQKRKSINIAFYSVPTTIQLKYQLHTSTKCTQIQPTQPTLIIQSKIDYCRLFTV